MERPMNEEDKVVRYHERFLDLAQPLLDSHWLNDKECNTLFWYGFHLQDHTMILGRVHFKPAEYLQLKWAFCIMHAIFLQWPSNLKKELWEVQDEYPELGRPHLNQRGLEHGPSISRHRVQDVVQELEDKVTRHQRRA